MNTQCFHFWYANIRHDIMQSIIIKRVWRYCDLDLWHKCFLISISYQECCPSWNDHTMTKCCPISNGIPWILSKLKHSSHDCCPTWNDHTMDIVRAETLIQWMLSKLKLSYHECCLSWNGFLLFVLALLYARGIYMRICLVNTLGLTLW